MDQLAKESVEVMVSNAVLKDPQFQGEEDFKDILEWLQTSEMPTQVLKDPQFKGRKLLRTFWNGSRQVRCPQV